MTVLQRIINIPLVQKVPATGEDWLPFFYETLKPVLE